MKSVSHTKKARECWGDELPDWIAVMAEAAERSSQGAIARELGISTTQVSQIIGRKYQGNMSNAEERVRGRLMKETMTCPVLGEIGPDVCRQWRANAQSTRRHNHWRVRMYRACKACPISKEEKDS